MDHPNSYRNLNIHSKFLTKLWTTYCNCNGQCPLLFLFPITSNQRIQKYIRLDNARYRSLFSPELLECLGDIHIVRRYFFCFFTPLNFFPFKRRLIQQVLFESCHRICILFIFILIDFERAIRKRSLTTKVGKIVWF